MANLNQLEVPRLDEDSPDLTDAEVASAVRTVDQNDFVQHMEEAIRPIIRPNVGGAIQGYDLRRRKPHLYCRTRIALHGEPDKVLVFQVDWLSQSTS